MSKDKRDSLVSQAKKLVAGTLRFHLEPTDAVKPTFKYRFEERPDVAPDSERGIPMTIVAEWKAEGLTELASYQLEAFEAGKYSVYFINHIDGEKQKLNVLFPGEKSYRLDLSRVSQSQRADGGSQ